MTEYSLQVTRIEPNPLWDATKAKEQLERDRGTLTSYNLMQRYDEQQTRAINVLTVTVTEEEWNRLKRAVLEGAK